MIQATYELRGGSKIKNITQETHFSEIVKISSNKKNTLKIQKNIIFLFSHIYSLKPTSKKIQ